MTVKKVLGCVDTDNLYFWLVIILYSEHELPGL